MGDDPLLLGLAQEAGGVPGAPPVGPEPVDPEPRPAAGAAAAGGAEGGTSAPAALTPALPLDEQGGRVGGDVWPGLPQGPDLGPTGPAKPASEEIHPGVEAVIKRVEAVLSQPGSIFQAAVQEKNPSGALDAVLAAVRAAAPAALAAFLRQAQHVGPSGRGAGPPRGAGRPGGGGFGAGPGAGAEFNVLDGLGLDGHFVDDLLAGGQGLGPPPGLDGPQKKKPSSKELLERTTRELLESEHRIPWHAVRKDWRQRRNAWRRAVRSAKTVHDLAPKVRDLYDALLMSSLSVAPEPAELKRWEGTLRKGISRGCSAEKLYTLWSDLRGWLGKDRVGAHSAEMEALAKTVIRRMEHALAKGEQHLSSVSLGKLLGESPEGFRLVQEFLEREKAAVHAKLARLNGSQKFVADVQPPVGAESGGEGAGGSVTKFGGGGWAVGLADDGADTDLESEVA